MKDCGIRLDKRTSRDDGRLSANKSKSVGVAVVGQSNVSVARGSRMPQTATCLMLHSRVQSAHSNDRLVQFSGTRLPIVVVEGILSSNGCSLALDA
jgi:hypothetical protein